MTVKLLCDWKDSRNGREYKAGNLLATDAGTESGLLAQKLADSNLSGGTNFSRVFENFDYVRGITLGDWCLEFDDYSDFAVSRNMKIIQEALDCGGNVSILGNGTLYWKGWTAEENLPAFSQPGRLLIGDDTDFYSGPGIQWEMQPDTYSSFGLFSNKNYVSNRVAVTGLSAAGKIRDHAVVQITLAAPINMKAGGYVIFGGFLNTGYAWNDGFRVLSVDVDGAATVLTMKVSKDVMVGVTLSALDSPYVYLANGNYSIRIDGLCTTGLGLGAPPVGNIDTLPQPEVGFINSNKTKNCRYRIRNIDGFDQLKAMVHTNSYDDVWEHFRKRNAGAGITLCGPVRSPYIAEVFNEGQEDVILIQTHTYPGLNHRGCRDADGTQSCGSIIAPRVGDMHCNLSEFRSMLAFASNDLNNVNIMHRVDGLVIDNVYCRGSSGATPTAFMQVYYGATANGGGGYVGRIQINNLVYTDSGASNQSSLPVIAVVKSMPATLRTNNRFGGIHIKNVSVPLAEDTAGATGLRNSLIEVGNSMGGCIVDEVIIEAGDIVLDCQNAQGSNIKLLVTGDNTNVLKSVVGAKVRHRYSLQSMAVSAGGTGYVVGDVIRVVVGGVIKPAVVKVAAVSGGVVTGITVIDKGAYDTLPSSPAATVGGAGTGLTLSFTNTYKQTFVWGVGATNSGWKLTEFYGDTVLENPSSLTQISNVTGQTQELRIHDVMITKLRNVAGAGAGNINITVMNSDLSGVSYNLFEGINSNSRSYNVVLGNVKFNSANAIINANAGLTGMNVYWRSLGGVYGLGANNLATNTASAGWTFSFTGCCADLKHDMNTVTLGRIDGAIVNEGGSTIGTPAAIGPGLIACFGTAASSWKSLNPSKSANSY